MSLTESRLESATPSPEQASGCDAPPTGASDTLARRWAWWLTAATIAWNTLEAVIAITSGVLAGSIALVGFGLDSVVEVSSARRLVHGAGALSRVRNPLGAGTSRERRRGPLVQRGS